MSQILVTGEAKIRDIQGPVVANSGVITALDGDASQYVRGDGTLADFPTSTGGGSSVSYYLNSSVSQGTISGIPYKQLSKTPISGAGTDITASTNGYIASYLTDANDPSLLEVPAGNFNCEFYFSVNSNNHNPYVFAELYKYNGSTFTLLGTSQAIPEYLTNGTTLSAYYFAIPVAVAALTITDRLAIRIYVNVDGRTVTLHTENNHLCQVVTTFSKGLTSLNNLTRQVQFLGTGTSGTDFNISSATATHTFNLPIASATNTGKLSSTDWNTFNSKQPAGNYVTLDTTQTITAAKTFSGGLSSISNSDSIALILRARTADDQAQIRFDNNAGGNTNAIINVFKIGDNGGQLSFLTKPNNSPLIAALTLESNGNATFGYPINGTSATFSNNISVNGLTVGKGSGSAAGNTAFGVSALGTNTTGIGNTGIGNNALTANTTGVYNTAIGWGSLRTNTTGDYNIAIIGLDLNTTGNANIAIGGLVQNTTGSNNIAIGGLINNTTGSNNISIGGGALQFSTTGEYNIGIGKFAGNSITNATYNTFLGNSAGSSITTGSNNTIVGNYNGTAALANNIVLADGAGNIRYQWNGTNNVFGNPISGTSAIFSGTVSSVVSSGSTSFRVVNADNSRTWSLIPYTNAAESDLWLYYGGTDAGTKVAFLNNGNVGIATTNPSYNLDVNGTGRFTGALIGRTANFTTDAHSTVVNSFVNTNTTSTDSRTILNITGGNATLQIQSIHNTGVFLNPTTPISTSVGYNNTLVLLANGNTTLSGQLGLGGALTGTTATFSNNIAVSSISVGTAGNGSNIKLGDSNFGAITTGSNNIAIGNSALTSITTSNANIGIGNSALASVVDGAFNTAIGFGIGGSITSGSNNALFGYGAGSAITTGNYNTIIGAYAGTAAMSNNIVLADGAGNIRYQWNGTNNVFGNPISGTSASFTAGGFNTYISESFGNTINFQFNQNGVAEGWINYRGYLNGTTQFRSLKIGNGKESAIATFDGSTGAATFTQSGGSFLINSDGQFISKQNLDVATAGGRFTGQSSRGTMGFIQIDQATTGADGGNIKFAVCPSGSTTPSEAMRITSGGGVLMGTTTDNNYRLGVEAASGGAQIYLTRLAANAQMFMGGTTAAGTQFYISANNSGGVYLAAGGVAWIAASDEKLKTDLVPIEDAANKVSSLRSVIGRYKTDAEGTKRAFLIAQDVLKVLPEAVSKNVETGDLGVSYTEVIPLLVAAIKEQQAQIELLSNKIVALESK